MNTKLTAKVKKYAQGLGADLVGVGNIERWEKAPIMMSPQGILPSAKSVVVCAIHHPDACIELGGNPEPQDIGPYAVQYTMNAKLDFISFKMGRFLDDMGYKTVPIAASNIWRYRPYKALDAIFSPDMSHIYAGACAGLGQIGWNGLCLTPEYGARNRFVSIITEAELEPTPLYDGPPVCDMCGECIKHCPTNAYRKEVNGTNVLEVEDKAWKFANKNLWRCAWGEHFDLDLNLEIPDVVDENVIVETMKKHGSRGGEFGVCLQVCLPPWLRKKDPGYSKVFRRKRHFEPAELTAHRDIITSIVATAEKWDADSVDIMGSEKLKKAGIDVTEQLPDGMSAILLKNSCNIPEMKLDKDKEREIRGSYRQIAGFNNKFAALDIARYLERFGYTALVQSAIDDEKLAKACCLDVGEGIHYDTIITSADLESSRYEFSGEDTDIKPLLDKHIRAYAAENGADLVGVASVQRLNGVLEQLKPIKQGERLFSITDKNPRTMEYDPEITEYGRKLYSPGEYIEGAKSVIIVGMHYPEAAVERAKQPPAEAVGPYVFGKYESERLLGHTAYSLVKELQRLGYKAVFSHDLLGNGAKVGSPRGNLQSSVNNAVEAVAAGLGQLMPNGNVYTEKYGINQSFIAIVTDAELSEDQVGKIAEIEVFCSGCGECIKQCPAAALSAEPIDIKIEGETYKYIPVDTIRCEWSSRYALCAEDGNGYVGSQVDIMPPKPGEGEVSMEQLSAALKQLDPVQKFRPVTAECCIISCPIAKGFDPIADKR